MSLTKDPQFKPLNSDVEVTISDKLLSSSKVLKTMIEDSNDTDDNKVIPLNLDSCCLDALLYWEKNQEIENEANVVPLLYAVDYLNLDGYQKPITQYIFEVMYPVEPTIDEVGKLMGMTGQELERKLYEIIDNQELVS